MEDAVKDRASTFIFVATIAAFASLLLASRPARADRVEAEFEAGAVWASRNDVRIPGSGGTGLSLSDELRSSATPVFRVRLGYRFGDRHLVTALVAPLRVNATGVAPRDIDFAGATYPVGTPLLAAYRFDSYRLTYRYSIARSRTLDVAVGATAKIRDAEISFHGVETSRKTNTGFVPLVNVHVEWRPGGGPLGLLLDADALAAPQGRAEDVLLAATWAIRDGVGLYAGYRTLEGGADNDEVYNFSWFHYAVAGLQFRL
jgi:hypothetical protein